MDSFEELFFKWKSRLSAPMLEAYIFYLLLQKERFGGELVQLSQAEIDKNVKVPTIYAILKRSTDLGLLEVNYHDVENGITRGTSRKYYTLTSEGNKYCNLILNHLSKSIPEKMLRNQGIVEVG